MNEPNRYPADIATDVGLAREILASFGEGNLIFADRKGFAIRGDDGLFRRDDLGLVRQRTYEVGDRLAEEARTLLSASDEWSLRRGERLHKASNRLKNSKTIDRCLRELGCMAEVGPGRFKELTTRR